MLRIIFSLAGALAVIGAATVFLGWITYQDAMSLDPSWERVTLAQWHGGGTKNKTLFEISEFEAGDEYSTLINENSEDFDMVYVPLFRSTEKDDSGAAAIAVVGIRNASNAEELESVLSHPFLNLQDYGGSMPPYAMELSESYPRIDWNKARWAIIDSETPSEAIGIWVMSGGGLLVLVSLPIFCFGVTLWRRPKIAEKRGFAESAAINEHADQFSSDRKTEIGSSFSTVFPVVGKWSGIVSAVCLAIGIALVLALKSKLVNEEVVMPFLFFFSPMFMLTGIISASAFFFAKPALKIKAQRSDEMPSRVMRKITPLCDEFQGLGFQFVGYAEAVFFAKKYHAYLLSRDQRVLVEITVEAGKESFVLVGATSDGLIYEIGKVNLAEDLYIDGTTTGVPLVAELKVQQDPGEAILVFARFIESLKETGCQLLTISPSSIFQFMHYESILAGWWAYNGSMRCSKPEPMPSIQEITQDGINFSFRRDESLASAYQNAGFNPSSYNSDSDEIATDREQQSATSDLYSSASLVN